MRKLEADSKQLNNLETKFLAFLQDVSLRPMEESPRQQGRDGLYDFTLRFHSDGVSLELSNSYGCYSRGESKFLSLQWGDEAINDAIAEAQRFCPNVSEKQVRLALRNLMIKMFHEQAVREDADVEPSETPNSEECGELETILEILDTSSVREELFEIIQQLEELAAPQVVYVPLEGLNSAGNLRIGDIEVHHRGNQNELDRVLLAIERRQGQDSVAYARRELKHTTCYATVELTGDDGFVRCEAARKVRLALHILNFCLSSSMHQPSWDRIRIASVIVNRRPLAGNPDEDPAGLQETYPTHRSLELSKNQLLEAVNSEYARMFSHRPSEQRNWQEEQEIVECGLQRLLTCFQASDDIAKRLQRAVTWYSKAVDADTPEEQFVDLAIALESLLIGDEGRGPHATEGSITQNLSERVAFLLEDNFERRCQRLDKTKKLYRQRSAIVHRGKRITEDDLYAMDKLVKQVTGAFLVRNFESWPSFQKWVAREKFGKSSENCDAS